MKWSAFIFASICLSCFPLVAQEGDQDPKATQAISYLQKVSKGEIDIAKHTALSPNCSIARRKIIRERLNFLRSNYLRSKEVFTVEEIKEGDQFAAVLIRAEHPSSPLSSRVYAIALLKTGDTWKPAPLPGTFANSGYGYDENIERQVKELERWMAREKIKRETAHREKAASEFQISLAQIEKKLQLDKIDSKEAVSNFINLCRSKDLMLVLAAMGAASDMLADSLEETISIVSRGLEIDNQESDWQIVTNPSSVFEIMKVDEKREEIAVGFYNPMLRRQSKVLYFPVEKKNNKTFVRLSPMLKIALLPENERWQQRWRHRRDDERTLILKVPSTILKNTDPKTVESPEELIKQFLVALKANRFREAIQMLPREGHHFEKDKEQAIVLANLATLWQGLITFKSAPRPRFDVLKEASLALAPLQYGLPNKPGKFQTWNIWMLKGAHGWQLVPENSIKSIEDKQIRQHIKTLEKRLVSMTRNQREELSQKMLRQVLKINTQNLQEAATTPEAQEIFKQYRSHLRSDDNQAALGCCAVLQGTDDAKTLKNFNYALRGIDDHIDDDQILGVTRSKHWSGISVRTQSKLAGTHDYPLYFCLKTSRGPKILLDIDLRFASNKGRKMLNESNWLKLKKILPAKALKEVETIFANHEKLVAKDKEAIKKLHE